MDYTNCKLCPRNCGIDRNTSRGFCKAPATAVVSKSMIHKWEEPVLAGEGGSGAVFFSSCSLRCIYCQNIAISNHIVGTMMDSSSLRACMEDLIAQGAENIDLITPTHYLPTIIPALVPKLPVPIVYNCGGYEKEDTIRRLDGLIDIYLPDMKYSDNQLSATLSSASDYFQCAKQALAEMFRQVGPIQWDGEKVKKGVIVRHLILPGHIENSLKVLDYLGETFNRGDILVSLMRQYTPMPGMTYPLDRVVTDEEYDAVLSWMYLNDLDGFVQDPESVGDTFIPFFE